MKPALFVPALAFLLFYPVHAQPASTADVQKLLEMLAEQQKQIASLQATLTTRLDEQQKVIDEQKRVIEELRRGRAPVTIAAGAVSVTAPAAPPAPAPAPAPIVPAVAPQTAKAPAVPKWFERVNFRGYTQIRHNRLYTSNESLVCESCDRFIGANTNLSLRRIRFVLSGDLGDRVSFYFQPEFAAASGNLNYGQIRDMYFDFSLTKTKEWRIRAGQSKVPYGFDNMQSSQNRLALDRSDGINSAAPNERDLGTYLFWAPAKIRARQAALSASGLNGWKGSGDYGVWAFGVYNGQALNRPEANNDLHYVTKLAYPWQLKNGRFVEAAIQAYTGKYTVMSDQRSATTLGANNFRFDDRRVGGTLVVYPQPLGFQAEYNVGVGPQFDRATRSIRAKTLNGGYAQTMYRRKLSNGQLLIPYTRWQYYNGGKKLELDTRSHLLREFDFGLEWQPSNFWELTGELVHADRTTSDGRLLNDRQKGNFFRVQLQVNY